MNLSPERKIAGVLVPLFALRREGDLGIGDVGALREFIDWIAGIGFKLVQLLPINETGADNSPYNAISAMAIEPLTIQLHACLRESLRRCDQNSPRCGSVGGGAVVELHAPTFLCCEWHLRSPAVNAG